MNVGKQISWRGMEPDIKQRQLPHCMLEDLRVSACKSQNSQRCTGICRQMHRAKLEVGCSNDNNGGWSKGDDTSRKQVGTDEPSKLMKEVGDQSTTD